MVVSGKARKKKFLERLREGLKEELKTQRGAADRVRQGQSARMDALKRIHREVLSRERSELRRVLLHEIERFRRRRLSSVLSALRGLSWVE